MGNVLANWFPILMMAAPTALALWFRERLIPDGAPAPGQRGFRVEGAAGGLGLRVDWVGLHRL